jgi:hypothetical protein
MKRILHYLSTAVYQQSRTFRCPSCARMIGEESGNCFWKPSSVYHSCKVRIGTSGENDFRKHYTCWPRVHKDRRWMQLHFLAAAIEPVLTFSTGSPRCIVEHSLKQRPPQGGELFCVGVNFELESHLLQVTLYSSIHSTCMIFRSTPLSGTTDLCSTYSTPLSRSMLSRVRTDRVCSRMVRYRMLKDKDVST